MHTGSRAFCFLMALAATGAECASAAVTPAASAEPGHYCVEAQSSAVADSQSISSSVVASHVFAIMAVSRVITTAASDVAFSPKAADFSLTPSFAILPVSIGACVYDADGRVTASVADANERQLLFVKISRG
jgi:hypothetical protein